MRLTSAWSKLGVRCLRTELATSAGAGVAGWCGTPAIGEERLVVVRCRGWAGGEAVYTLVPNRRAGAGAQ
jgi:hypothetical protein